MKIAIIVGTRPEVIKMAPVIRECLKRSVEFFIIHSNQHYSKSMDSIFFKEMELPPPKYNLNVGSGTHSNQTGNILIKIGPVLEQEMPDIVLVQGDTNTVLASALSAKKLGIKVAHIEAGLRCYDRSMPEETNRIATDHIADYLFAVTNIQKNILEGEGVSQDKVFVVGNTVVDSVQQYAEKAKAESHVLSQLGLYKNEYCLFTAHRASNVDSLGAIQETLNLVKAMPMTVVWPIHPRAKAKIQSLGLNLPENVVSTEPLGYLDFLSLQQNSSVVVTDSGGVQEEACILGVPCITIRDNTERPETLDVGSNILVGRDLDKLTVAMQAIKKSKAKWRNPFGDGRSAQKILNILCDAVTTKSIKESVSVIGMGYMGLPTALLFAHSGCRVQGFDIDEGRVKSLSRGQCFFDEPGISELLKEEINSKRFSVSTVLKPANVFIIAVPTPHKNQKCDLSYVEKACQSVATKAKDGNLVIIESTVRPGACENVVKPIFERVGINVNIAYCPERAIPGSTLNELRGNSRVIGVSSPEVGAKVKSLYKNFVTGEIFLTNLATAEATKLMENTFRDVNIALANEFSLLSDELGFNLKEAIRFANHHPRVNILQPGPGVGGHCIPIDPWFLVENSKVASLIPTARKVNDKMPEVTVKRFYKKMGISAPSKIAVLGLAYKKNVDDWRSSPSLEIIRILKKDGHQVLVHDPHVKDWPEAFERDLNVIDKSVDFHIVATNHDTYKRQTLSKPVFNTNLI